MDVPIQLVFKSDVTKTMTTKAAPKPSPIITMKGKPVTQEQMKAMIASGVEEALAETRRNLSTSAMIVRKANPAEALDRRNAADAVAIAALDAEPVKLPNPTQSQIWAFGGGVEGYISASRSLQRKLDGLHYDDRIDNS